jgi:AcrR family transcriptional regulator
MPRVAKSNKAGRPTASELERRKQRVLDVATELFLKNGYSATSLSDIARKAAVATRTVYQHFGDKEAVFAAIVDARIKGEEVKLDGVADDQSLFDVLMKVAEYACGMSFEQQAVPFTRLMIAESMRFPKLMQGITQSIEDRFWDNVGHAFKTLAARGDIPGGDQREAVQFFIDLILGLAPLHAIMNPPYGGPGKAELEAKVRLYILGRFGPEVAKRAQQAPGRRLRDVKRSKAAVA